MASSARVHRYSTVTETHVTYNHSENLYHTHTDILKVAGKHVIRANILVTFVTDTDSLRKTRWGVVTTKIVNYPLSSACTGPTITRDV